jgi:hypothetical protein
MNPEGRSTSTSRDGEELSVHGTRVVVSADTAFGGLRGIRRVDPLDASAFDRVLSTSLKRPMPNIRSCQTLAVPSST